MRENFYAQKKHWEPAHYAFDLAHRAVDRAHCAVNRAHCAFNRAHRNCRAWVSLSPFRQG